MRTVTYEFDLGDTIFRTTDLAEAEKYKCENNIKYVIHYIQHNSIDDDVECGVLPREKGTNQKDEYWDAYIKKFGGR